MLFTFKAGTINTNCIEVFFVITSCDSQRFSFSEMSLFGWSRSLLRLLLLVRPWYLYTKHSISQVLYYPIFLVVPCSRTFYTPSYFCLFPLLADDVAKAPALSPWIICIWKVNSVADPDPHGSSKKWKSRSIKHFFYHCRPVNSGLCDSVCTVDWSMK